MIAVATGFSLLVKSLRDSTKTINEVNQACIKRGLPPAFYMPDGGGIIRGNTDYRLDGFGVDIISVLPPRLALKFWVQYRIDSDDHVNLGKFSCPLKVFDLTVLEMIGSLSPLPLGDIQFNEELNDLSDNSQLIHPNEEFEDVDAKPDQPADIDEPLIEVDRVPDLENYILRATQNTVLKISPVPSPELSENEKISFSAQSSVPLVSFQDLNDHCKVTLANTTLGGRKTWVAYKGHIEILKPDGTRVVGQYKIGDPLLKQVNLAVPWYSQRDNKYHPGATCNVTSVAMILAYFGVRPKSNVQLEDQLYLEVTENGRNYSDKNSHKELDELIKSYGLKNKFSTETSWQAVKQHLANGNPVIISGKFTGSGHIIVLRGYDETGFWVNDPWGEWFSNGYRNLSGENLHYSYNLCFRCSYGGDNSTWAHLPSDPNKTFRSAVLSQSNNLPTDIPVVPSMTAAECSKRTAQAIVNIFETGKPLGDYSAVVCHVSDPGGLTYGRSQTTIHTGNLYFLVKAYCEAEGAKFANKLRPYLENLANKSATLKCGSGSDDLRELTAILKAAGTDPVMQSTQDDFFDRAYWTPAFNAARTLGIQTALGKAVVYDSFIHGSWARMRDRTNQANGTVSQIGEKAWIKAYISIRRHWLGNHSNRLLRNTVYRMDAFNQLIQAGNWDLKIPFSVRGCRAIAYKSA